MKELEKMWEPRSLGQSLDWLSALPSSGLLLERGLDLAKGKVLDSVMVTLLEMLLELQLEQDNTAIEILI